MILFNIYIILLKKELLLNKKDFKGKNIVNDLYKLSEEINKLIILFYYIEEKNIYKNYDNDLNLLNKLKNENRIWSNIKIIIPETKNIVKKYIDIFSNEIDKLKTNIYNNKNKDDLLNKKSIIQKAFIEEKIKDLIFNKEDEKFIEILKESLLIYSYKLNIINYLPKKVKEQYAHPYKQNNEIPEFNKISQ